MTATAIETRREPRDHALDTAATVAALHRRVLELEGLVKRLARKVSDLEGRETI